MTVQWDIPVAIEQKLQGAWGNLSRPVLEATAVEAYRQGILSRHQVGELLNMNFWQTEAFLKAHGANLHYSEEELIEDQQNLSRLLDR
jgi:predicted HTH domain antitoxin